MTKEKNTTDDEQKKPLSIRLFADSEDEYTIKRPSVAGFETIRKIALKSIEITLARKFEICEELCLYWKDHLKIEGMKALKKMLENMADPNPIYLGDKVLASQKITEKDHTGLLSVVQAQAKIAEVILKGPDGKSPIISKERIDEMLLGNVRNASVAYFSQINIGPDENLDNRRSFRAFVNSDDEFPLTAISVKTLKKLNELQISTPCMPEKERKKLAKEMRIDFKKFSPEKIQDGTTKADYWRKAAEILLDGVTLTDKNSGLIDAGEVNRALAVFFLKSDGSL